MPVDSFFLHSLLQVPENLLSNTHFSVSPEIAYHRAMILTNNQLHRQPDVDDSMSGTTAIGLLLRNRMAYVANVGDSRAVLAERQGDRLVAIDLSFDQTPFRCAQCVCWLSKWLCKTVGDHKPWCGWLQERRV